MNREIILDKNMQELTPQGDINFPFNLMHITLSHYPFYNFPCHWHPELEITYILEGEMTYIVNQTSLHLKKTDCILVNTNALHAGEQYQSSDCRYICFVFDPVLIYGFEHSVCRTDFVAPILDNTNFDYILIDERDPEHLSCCDLIGRLDMLATQEEDGYPLLITSVLFHLWYLIYQVYNRKLVLYPDIVITPAQERQIQRLKDALAFIYENYASNITLSEIADSCHTSKSEFCRLFKQALHQSPFDFLLRYRIEQSLALLQDNDLSITEIAIQVGFSGPSYYAEVFKRYMLCSPTAYRKKHLQKTNSEN